MKRASCFLQLGNPIRAIEDCSTVLSSDSQNVDALTLRGQAWMASNHPSTAIEDYSELLKRTPDAGQVWFSRAAARAACGDPAGALEDCERARPFTGEETLFRLSRSHVLALLGRFQEALQDLDLVAQEPSWFQQMHLHSQRARLHEMMGDLPGALKIYRDAESRISTEKRRVSFTNQIARLESRINGAKDSEQ